MPPEIRATFPNEADARQAAEHVTAAGINPTAITITSDNDSEGPFLTRLVITIALWSIAGGIIGVGLGALIWLIFGPEGTTGLLIQAIVWGIFGHLIIGMWAGYLLLADRTQPDLPHDRPAYTLTIHVGDQATLKLANDVLADSGTQPKPKES